MTQTISLAGRMSSLTVKVGGAARTRDTPLICASEVGYSPLGAALGRTLDDAAVARLSSWMRNADTGPWVAVIDAPPAPRPLVIIQSDRPGDDDGNYYSKNRPGPGVWRDYYYAATYAALKAADETWRHKVIELTHPTGHGWPPDLVRTVLEALGHLADEERLTCETVYLGCCTNDLTSGQLERAMADLNREQTGSDAPSHRGVEITVSGTGDSELDAVARRLLRVTLTR